MSVSVSVYEAVSEEVARHNKDANYAFWITITTAALYQPHKIAAASNISMHNKIIKKSLSETRTLFKRSLHISLIFMLFVDHSPDSNDFVCTNVDTPSSIRVAFLYDFAHFPEQIDWRAAVSCKPFHARNGAIHQWRKCLLKILVNVLWLDLLYAVPISGKRIGLCSKLFWQMCAHLYAWKKNYKITHFASLTFWFLSSMPFLFCAVFELA